jgi:hypothetical protein
MIYNFFTTSEIAIYFKIFYQIKPQQHHKYRELFSSILKINWEDLKCFGSNTCETILGGVPINFRSPMLRKQ